MPSADCVCHAAIVSVLASGSAEGVWRMSRTAVSAPAKAMIAATSSAAWKPLTKKKTPNIASATRSIAVFAPAKVALRIGRPLVFLSPRVALRGACVFTASGHLSCLLVGIPGCPLLVLDGEVHQQCGALPGRAGDRDAPAQRLDPVGEPDEPGAPPPGGATGAVVADRQVQAAVTRLDLDMGGRGVGVLGGVGQRLGDDVVRGDLDLLGQPRLDVHVELDRDGGAAGQRLQRGTEAALGQDRRVDAT